MMHRRVFKTNVLGARMTLLDNVKFSFDTHEPLAHRQNDKRARMYAYD